MKFCAVLRSSLKSNVKGILRILFLFASKNINSSCKWEDFERKLSALRRSKFLDAERVFELQFDYKDGAKGSRWVGIDWSDDSTSTQTRIENFSIGLLL